MPVSTGNNELGTYSQLLATTEVGLGSLLHSFHLPMTGQLLSLNQIFVLSLAYRESARGSAPAVISSLAAGFRLSLGTGKKITPCIAIAMQGYLFAVGAYFNVYLGAVLSSLWAYLQPLILFYAMSSGKMVDMHAFYLQYFAKFYFAEQLLASLSYVLVLCVVGKAMLAGLMVKAAQSLSDEHFAAYRHFIARTFVGPLVPEVQRPTLRQCASDLIKPFYVISLALIAFYLYQSAEGALSFAIASGRAILCTFLVVVISRYLGFWSLPYLVRSKAYAAHLQAMAHRDSLKP